MTTSIKQLKQAKAFFAQNPNGTVKIIGNGFPKVYTKAEWEQWFIQCLMAKINRNEPAINEERFNNLKRDARIINEYFGTRNRRRGTGILSDRKMQARYPFINNNLFEN